MMARKWEPSIVSQYLKHLQTQLRLPEGVEARFPGHYHTTVATIVQGELVPSAIGFQDGASSTTTNFFLSDSSNIVSIAKLTPVDYKPGADDEIDNDDNDHSDDDNDDDSDNDDNDESDDGRCR